MSRVVFFPARSVCQAVQGENGYFMALDMETGGVSMIPLHGLQKTQQVHALVLIVDLPKALLPPARSLL